MKYINLFDNLDAANEQGQLGLDAPQVNFVSGKTVINFYDTESKFFNALFDEDGKMIVKMSSDEIWYKTTDRNIIDLGGSLLDFISNKYENEKCVAICSTPITRTGGHLMVNQETLTEISFPDTLITLNDDDFSYCSNLEKVTLGSGTTEIGACSFEYCSKLKEINVENIERIEYHAFSHCEELEELRFEKLNYVEYAIFEGCTNLKKIELAMDTVLPYANNAFIGCDADIYVPFKLYEQYRQTWSDYANKFKVQTPPNDEIWYTTYGNYPVDLSNEPEGCGANVVSNELCDDGYFVVKFDAPITKVGGYEFYNSNIVTIALPKSVNYVEYYCFSSCQYLKNVLLNDTLSQIRNGIFAYDTSLEYINIPSGITMIGDYAFQQCYALTGVTLPDGITQINNETFSECRSLFEVRGNNIERINAHAFYACSSLTYVSNTKVRYYGTECFSQCKDYCGQIYTDTPSATTIEYGAFDGCHNFRGLTGPYWPIRCNKIPRRAFCDCKNMLYMMAISASSIEELAFNGCSNLRELDIHNESGVISCAPDALSGLGDGFAVYVWPELVEQYQNDSFWRNYDIRPLYLPV